MKHINQRNIKIIDELMCFCYKYGAKKINIQIDRDENAFYIHLNTEIHNLPNEVLEITRNLLSAPRCHEMEEYYWNLTGDDDTDTELTLVGMMTDDTEVNYTDNKYLELKLQRLL